ncbi:SH3 domain-containing protein [Tabrizicola sp. M-4]|uniref:SH3 domain-containing protein n=1 Tax=Tabrizicola sp. M-4 TaxID=3055847 RepID=UPI003DA83A50
MTGRVGWALAGVLVLGGIPALGQEVTRPMPRPDGLVPAAAQPAPPPEAAPPLAAPSPAPAATTPTDGTAAAAQAASPTSKAPLRDPNRGAVTNLPLPRYVSLKGNEGNARRGPGLTHRIDWVFTRSGMPLKITAEYENWRRVEDAEGVGGWVHYSLLSGVRSVLIAADIAEFHSRPQAESEVIFKAERNVVGWVQECEADWCRISVDGERGWVEKASLWGVAPGEVVE